MNKKGVELSMNLIIIAAIGLLILVILAVLVVNSSSKVPAATQSCNLQGGLCQALQCNAGASILAKDCGPSTPNCCKVVSTG